MIPYHTKKKKFSKENVYYRKTFEMFSFGRNSHYVYIIDKAKLFLFTTFR